MTAKCGEFPAAAVRLCRRGAQGKDCVVTSRAGSPDEHAQDDHARSASLRDLAARLPMDRSIALVGMMGAGKTSIGKRLAAALGVAFRDADAEIEKAAGRSIAEIFAERGETEFRRGERKVIARLITCEPPHVLATGGGAFMDLETRALLKAQAVTIWLRAELDVLLHRVERRDHRPLLRAGDPRATLARLIAERHPIYAEADLAIDSNPGPHAVAVEAALRALGAHAARRSAP
jgi:shikimate kinase